MAQPEQEQRLPVTVVIVNWNGGACLEKCLGHVAELSPAPEKVLLVDNGSTDGSLEHARRFSGVTVLALAENRGFAAANNLGLRHCDSEFVALLNPDAYPRPDWLGCLVAAASRHPEAAAFGSRQLVADHSDVIDGVGDLYHLSGRAWRDRNADPGGDDRTRSIFSPCAAAALYRRQALLDVGGFDEDFFCYMEDVDLGFRIRLAGHDCRYVADAVVHHVGSATTGGSHSDFSTYHGHRNLVWTFVKNMPGILFWILLPLHLVLNLASLIFLALRGQAGVGLRAKRDALAGLPQALRKRRLIQARRVASTATVWRALDRRLMPPLSMAEKPGAP